jgi:hypothetical protein
VLVKVVNSNQQNVEVPYFYTFIGCTHIITYTFFAFQYNKYIALMMILAFHYHEVNKPSHYWISIFFVNKQPFPLLVRASCPLHMNALGSGAPVFGVTNIRINTVA